MWPGFQGGPEDVSLLEKCPHLYWLQSWRCVPIREVSSFQRVVCTGFNPEDVSLLERCPHFRGWYVQASMELGPEDVSLLERC